MIDIIEAAQKLLLLQEKPKTTRKKLVHALAGVWMWLTVLTFSFLLFLRSGDLFLEPASASVKIEQPEEKVEVKRVLEGFFDFRTTVILKGDDNTLKKIQEHPDSISAAYQLGRLDLVTVILGIVAIAAAVFSYVSYFAIKNKAKKIARKAVTKELETGSIKLAVREYLDTPTGSALLKSIADEAVRERATAQGLIGSDDSAEYSDLRPDE